MIQQQATSRQCLCPHQVTHRAALRTNSQTASRCTKLVSNATTRTTVLGRSFCRRCSCAGHDCRRRRAKQCALAKLPPEPTALISLRRIARIRRRGCGQQSALGDHYDPRSVCAEVWRSSCTLLIPDGTGPATFTLARQYLNVHVRHLSSSSTSPPFQSLVRDRRNCFLSVIFLDFPQLFVVLVRR